MLKLEAINLILSGVGEPPIEDIDNPYSDITQAVMIFDSVISEVQNTAYHFNSEKTVLKQDVNGRVMIPSDTHRVIFDDPFCPYRMKSGKLYDTENHTDIIGSDVPVTLIKKLPFDEIPETFQYYITMRSARKYQNNILTATGIQKFQEQDEVEAKLAAMKEEQAVTKPNIKGYVGVLNGWSVGKTLRR